VADFGSGEPGVPYILWQFSDSYLVPGVGAADCSMFRGSVEELAALAYQGTGQPASPAPAPPAPPSDWREFLALLPVLKLGDADTEEPWMVKRVQSLVDALGPDCPVTGVFDGATEAAVKAFQENHGVTASGACDAATWSMLVFGRAL
jgi:peptidoglycan hydrolase-like protein with peptidoglycan-binding domain